MHCLLLCGLFTSASAGTGELQNETQGVSSLGPEHVGVIVNDNDPLSREIVWEYRGSPESPFYSRTCGVAQRVSNGNTLITESDSGRAFEVTPDGEIVWEFYNPRRAGEKGRFIATLFELVRLPPDFPTDWAE